MLTKEITVKYYNPPKGKGPASVKDENGDYWKFWPSENINLDKSHEGATLKIGYEPDGVWNGKQQHKITSVQNITGKQLQTPSQPAPTGGNGHSDSRDKNIFICGVVNQGIAAGKIDPFSAIDLINVRKAATEAFEKVP
jgi:hypothetical protein